MQRLGVVAAMRDEECRAWLALSRLLVAADTDYPTMLKEIAAPPPLIYAPGPVDLRARAVAVAGTCNASYYGRADLPLECSQS